MKETAGNIWDYHRAGYHIVIPTNGYVKKSGELVMGRGLALDAKKKFPELSYTLGKLVKSCGNHVLITTVPGLISFPVKHSWYDAADPNLIHQSAEELVKLVNDHLNLKWQFPICLPRVGCGNGRLDWKEVKSIIEPILDDRFLIVNL